MTSLQLGLIVAGIALVVGVIVYNWLQERRIRRRIDSTFRKPQPDTAADAEPPRRCAEPSASSRRCPRATTGGAAMYASPENPPADRALADEATDAAWEPPVETQGADRLRSLARSRGTDAVDAGRRVVERRLQDLPAADRRRAGAACRSPIPTSNAW